MKKYMKIALNEAKKALKCDEVPVGAVIVQNGKIISKAHNTVEKNNNCVDHAEILAITKACKKNNNWRLDDCEIYVTMEPCMMCCGAIKQARIKKIIYGISNEQYGCTKKIKNVEIIPNVMKLECKEIIQTFFKQKR